MKRTIASILSVETGIGCLTVGGALFWLCLMAILCFSSGCSTVRSAWYSVAGTPVAAAQRAEAKVEHAAAKVEKAKESLVGDAHTKVVLAELLSRHIAEQSKTAAALKSTLTAARADLDTARGPKAPDELSGLRTLVEQLRSENAKAVAAGEQALAELDNQSAKSATILRAALAAEGELRERATAAEGKAQQWALERDEVARKWERLWWWIWVAAGAWIAAQVLPLVARLVPAIAPAATAISAIASPISTYALGKAKALAKDASSALHNVVTAVHEKAPGIVDQVERIKAEWITPEDGTTTAYTAALREAQQI